MHLAPENRRTLQLASHARGKRSPVTCRLKCGDACAQPVPNTSENDYFPEVASRSLARRAVLGGAGAGALAIAFASSTPAAAATPGSNTTLAGAARGRGVRFAPILPVPSTVDAVTVPRGWEWSTVIRWGDPLFADSPEFDPQAQTGTSQEQQFGYNCDYLDVIPLNKNGRRALGVVNHEYTNENIMFAPTEDAAALEEQKRVAMAAHGLTVVELRRRAVGRPYSYVRGSEYNRRFTATTPFRLTGPVAGSDLVKTAADPEGTTVLGTLNNCAGGTTPWGTVLSGEENFNQYFVAGESPANERYGIPTDEEDNRAWWTVEPRFDARVAGNENEVNRFGWIVEVDPFEPESTPVKHTAMGRFKHEGANIRLARDGRAVAYMGDDERFEYIYKFVSSKTMRKGDGPAARRHNKTLLDEGDLYVAKFTGDSPAAEIDGTGTLPEDDAFDGRGQWLPLVEDGESKVPGMTVEEVLVNTRLAADLVGPTKMDRPEDVQPSPVTGRIYAALTNNSRRGVDDNPGADEANPRNPNRDGHVLEIVEYRDDALASSFSWNLLLVCGSPGTAGTYFGGYQGPVSPIACPDNVTFDETGALWISTDGQPGTIGLNDALHRVSLDGRNRGRVEQFLAVPVDAETCGPTVRAGEEMVFVCVQHPGEEGSWEEPTSLFPDYAKPGTLSRGTWGGPRPSVIQVYRD
ncbi:MAG: PhoX family protein [Dermatophilaceae bacterium]